MTVIDSDARLPARCGCGERVVLASEPFRWIHPVTGSACVHDPDQARDYELAQLIAAQAEDARRGHHQWRESGFFKAITFDRVAGWLK